MAHHRASSGNRDAVASLLSTHLALTRSEPGCLQFLVYRSADDRDVFALYERYVDEAAFQSHRESEHFRYNIVNGVVPLLTERSWLR
jgi:quinol monooxygenase YgiN